MNIGFLFADELEFKPFSEYACSNFGAEKTPCKSGCNCISFELDENTHCVAVESGIGKINAAAATAELILEMHCDAVLNAGLSGGIKDVAREDIIAGSEYCECDMDLTAVGFAKGEKPGSQRVVPADEKLLLSARSVKGIKTGRLGTGDLFLSDKALKAQFSKEFAVNAFDMESAAAAGVCLRYDIPFISVRKISDDAENGAEQYREMNERCELDLTAVIFDVAEKYITL